MLYLPNYVWIGQNREATNKLAKRGSGGIGVFIHHRLLKSNTVSVLSDKYEGILWVQLKSKRLQDCLLVCVCYLPPKDTSRYVDGGAFFDRLLTDIYLYQNIGQIKVGGDFNARRSDMSDFIEGADNIPPRSSIDQSEKLYGNYLINFLVETNFCMLNGRLGINNYTSISNKGKAVVDYVLIPHSQLSDHNTFKVETVTEIARAHGISPPVKVSQMSDHSMLSTHVRWTTDSYPDMDSSETKLEENGNIKQHTKFKVESIPVSFMSHTKPGIQRALKRINDSLKEKSDVNLAYESLCDMVQAEMENSLPKFKSKAQHKRYPVKQTKLRNKAWWNKDLSALWDNVCQREYEWLHHRGGGRSKTKETYVSTRRQFDYEHRKARRAYQKKQIEDLADSRLKNPSDFWRKIDKLGINKERKQKIPLSISNIEGNTGGNIQTVLDKWGDYFDDLLNDKNNENNYDTYHYQQVINNLHTMEQEPVTANEQNGLDMLNRDISFGEVKAAEENAKNRKQLVLTIFHQKC